MNRSSETVVVVLVVIAVLAVLYTGGYWVWVLPRRVEIVDYGIVIYYLEDTTLGRTIGILYSPVFYLENARVWFEVSAVRALE